MLLEVDQTSTEYKQVLKTFQGKWVKNPPAPAADCIFKIFVPQVEAQFKQYQSSLANQTVESHFHGTTMKCDLLSTKKPCKTKNCGICEISRHGFDLKKIGTNISFMRFGRGFYLAPNSSKCHFSHIQSHTLVVGYSKKSDLVSQYAFYQVEHHRAA